MNQQKLESPQLNDLARRINAEHGQCETSLNDGLRHALEAGRLLLQAKSLLCHGQWLPWLRTNFQGAPRTARAYTLIVKRWPQVEAKRQRDANLSIREMMALTASPRAADTTEAVLREAIALMKQALALQADELTNESLPAAYWTEQKRAADAAFQHARCYTLQAERRLGELLLAIPGERGT